MKDVISCKIIASLKENFLLFFSLLRLSLLQIIFTLLTSQETLCDGNLYVVVASTW